MPSRIQLGWPCVSSQPFSPQTSGLIFIYSIRAKLRACDEKFDWLSSYHSKCFYPDYDGDATHLESGYLKSSLLVKVCRFTPALQFIFYLLVLQVYKAIFTSPSSAKDVLEEDDDENMPPAKLRKTSSSSKPVRRNVASKLHLNGKVTPRSIAYAAVQVCLFLLHDVRVLCSSVTASSTLTSKLQVHGPQFMKDSTTRVCTITLLMFLRIPLGLLQRDVPKIYWNGGRSEYSSSHKEHLIHSGCERKIFPTASLHRLSNTSASRKAFKQQRAALEEEEGAWAVLLDYPTHVYAIPAVNLKPNRCIS